jgi:hypothetical protein
LLRSFKMPRPHVSFFVTFACLLATGCSSSNSAVSTDGGRDVASAHPDGGSADARKGDVGSKDAGRPDTGVTRDGGGDAGPTDAPVSDAAISDVTIRDARATHDATLPTPGNVSWILDPGYAELVAKSHSVPDASGLALAYFDTSRSYIAGDAEAPFLLVTRAQHFVTIDSFDASGCNMPSGFAPVAMSVALDSTTCGTLDPSVNAVVYDVEAWCITPDADKGDPGNAYARASQLVKNFNASCRPNDPLLFIGTPGTDLADVLDGGHNGGSGWQKFVNTLQIPRKIAPSVDILEIQAQPYQNDAGDTLRFLAAAAAQAREASAPVGMMAGFAVSPDRLPSCKPSVLYPIIEGTFGVYQGYWINPAGNFCGDGGTTGTITQGDIGALLLQAMEQGVPPTP